MALVSVIIPAYNQSRYLNQALQSVLEQTLRDLEIIVVDDGSTDDTAQIVQSLGDSRIRYIYQENRGLSAARNTGIRNSEGAFLTFLDSDDLFLPTKLEFLVLALEKHPEAGIASGRALLIDESGNRIGKAFDEPLPEDPVQLLLGNPLHVGSVIVRRSWQEKVGYFDERLRSYEDWDMWLRLSLAGCRPVWVPEPVSLYRFHKEQMTRIGTQMTEATFAVLDKFFAQSNLPREWSGCKDMAYSRAHLRAAAQAYRVREFILASNHLSTAVNLDPGLMKNGASTLADRFRSWTELPKIQEPLSYLQSIYEHLPSELQLLSDQKRCRLGEASAQLAFEFYQKQNLVKARRYALMAFKYTPSRLLNRGLLAIVGRSVITNKGVK